MTQPPSRYRYRRSRARCSTRRRVAFESLESRTLLAADAGLGPSLLALDATGDGWISAVDALAVMHGVSEYVRDGGTPVRPELDTNGDGVLSAGDALPLLIHLDVRGPVQLNVQELWSEQARGLSDAQLEKLNDLFADVNAMRVQAGLSSDQAMQLVEDIMTALDEGSVPSDVILARLFEDFGLAHGEGMPPTDPPAGGQPDPRQVE